jgi:hypothetical protein
MTTYNQRKEKENSLGTFSSKRISPGAGIARSENDQERPFAINLPGLDEDGRSRESKEERDREKAARKREKTRKRIERNERKSAATSSTQSGPISNGGKDVRSETSMPVSAITGSSSENRSTPSTTVISPGVSSPSTNAPERAPSFPTATSVSNAKATKHTKRSSKDDTPKKISPTSGLAELPGSKAPGAAESESEEEEVVMSATAYPGQEWMPYDVGMPADGRWDD